MKKSQIFGLLIALAFLLPAFVVVGEASETMVARPKPPSPPGQDKPDDPVPDPDPEPEPGTGDGVVKKYALIIGISDYEGTSSDLSYCDDDAMDWKSRLSSMGYTIDILLNSQATANNIIAAFEDLGAKHDGDDWIAICYSGHGYYSKSIRQSGLVSHDLYLVAEDTIEGITDNYASKHVFMFLDCCNAGTFANIVNDGWVAGIGSTKSSYTYDGTSDMANGIYTYFAVHGAIDYYNYNTAEDICAYAEAEFDSATPGNASTVDKYTGDMVL